MKRFLSLLLCCLLFQGVALAEDNRYSVLTSMDGYYGVWAVCSGNGDYEYLVLHDNGTYEAYEAWTMAKMPTPGDALIRHGAFTFDPATGDFTLEGDPLDYTLQTCTADGLLSSDGGVEGTSEMHALCLYAKGPEVDGVYDDQTKVFLPMEDGMVLLPTYETLNTDGYEWNRSDTFHDFVMNTTSYRFTEYGAGAFMTYTDDADEADVELLAYVLDNGAMTVTMADGTTHHWLTQYAYYLFTGENSTQIDESMEKYFDDMDDEYVASDALWSDRVILVRDLDNNTSFYLIASEG